MFSRLIFIFIICFLIVGGWFFIQQKQSQVDTSASVVNNVVQSNLSLEINNVEINLEIVGTSEEMKKGLSGRIELAENQGMLFIFGPPGFYSFWMKGMLFPIDIIWINENKEVVYIKENLQPCVEEDCQLFTPDKKTKYVLEVKAGTVDRVNIKIGDEVTFSAEL